MSELERYGLSYNRGNVITGITKQGGGYFVKHKDAVAEREVAKQREGFLEACVDLGLDNSKKLLLVIDKQKELLIEARKLLSKYGKRPVRGYTDIIEIHEGVDNFLTRTKHLEDDKK